MSTPKYEICHSLTDELPPGSRKRSATSSENRLIAEHVENYPDCAKSFVHEEHKVLTGYYLQCFKCEREIKLFSPNR